MKWSLQIAALAFSMTGATHLAIAQNDSSAKDASHAATKTENSADKKLAPDLNRASKVIGTDVLNPQGKKIGDIKDVVLDRARGQVAYAVVSFGGMLGMGTKYFAIPWKSLQPNADNKYVLNVDPEKLKKAPGFDKDHWPDMASEKWNADTHGYYNQTPYWQDSTAAGRNETSSSGSSGAGKDSGNK